MGANEYSRRIGPNIRLESINALGPDDQFNYWISLFLPATDLKAPEFGFKTGDIIYDAGSQIMMMAVEDEGDLFWNGVNCNLLIATATANVDAYKLLNISESGGVLRCTVPTGQGAAWHGVALNPATTGQRVYVVTRGNWWARSGASQPAGGAAVATTSAGLADTAASGNFYSATCVSRIVTRSAVNYQLMSMSGVATIRP